MQRDPRLFRVVNVASTPALRAHPAFVAATAPPFLLRHRRRRSPSTVLVIAALGERISSESKPEAH